MAIENQVILNGQIRSLQKIRNKGDIVQITAGVLVMRRPKTIVGNRSGDIKTDIVVVTIRNEEMIKYMEEKNAATGDIIEVAGVYCTLRGMKTFYCKHCGTKNSFEGSVSFVHPLCIKVSELNPKRAEIVRLSPAERKETADNIKKILMERKSFKGDIIGIKDLGEKDDGFSEVRVISREEIKDKDVLKYLQWMGEISNRIYIMGNVCADPTYNPKDNGGRVCTYQLGINRKLFIKEDDPDIRADYPWVKSLGDQADKDNVAIRKGSLVFIDGSIQAREDFIMEKQCENCGETCKVKGQAMEIVPYSVEYLRNCNTDFEDEKDDDEYDDFADLAVSEEERDKDNDFDEGWENYSSNSDENDDDDEWEDPNMEDDY